ncbi:hypothetical protein GCM10007884_05880 [Methylobacterium brachythecii]|uniref:Uncharacterized protein n=1 Tax=Methylobacterium brachythecii TaxID=1176177 RepID=A0ABQ6CZ83_9HYPH|nr:hypothetical protein GCM10007884_05880 [Methylobacterium brachythecii]
MSQYFFDLRSCTLSRDYEIGSECDDLDAIGDRTQLPNNSKLAYVPEEFLSEFGDEKSADDVAKAAAWVANA